MKKVLLILSFALALAAGRAAAQNVVLGERVPELKAPKWLDDREPTAAPATYIEFFHSSNPACTASLDKLKKLTGKLGTKLRVIVVTKEDAVKIAPPAQALPLAADHRGTRRREGIHGLRRDLCAVRGAHGCQKPRGMDGQLPAIQ